MCGIELRALFLFVVFASCCQPNEAAGEMAVWWANEYELNFVEAAVLIALVFVALIFEFIWHHLSGPTHRTYKYGSLQLITNETADEHDKIQHLRLFNELSQRMGGEFMSLGFLGFTIFIANQSGLFVLLSRKVDPCGKRLNGGCWHLPATSTDWLILAELVHVKLFVAMMFYFVLVCGLVRSSVRNIRRLERLWLRHQERLSSSKLLEDEELKQYHHTMDYFIARALKWRNDAPGRFSTLLCVLEIDTEDEDNYSMILERLRARFSLSAYLAFGVERGVKDSIQVQTSTWLCIMFIFFICALLERYAEFSLDLIAPVIVGFAALIVLCIISISWWTKKQIRLHSTTEVDLLNSVEKIFECHRTDQSNAGCLTTVVGKGDSLVTKRQQSFEVHFLRLLQALMFVPSFALSSSIIDPIGWKKSPITTLYITACFALCFVLLLYLVPRSVPNFLELMALPPFVDDDDLSVLFQVLLDQNLHICRTTLMRTISFGDVQGSPPCRRSLSSRSNLHLHVEPPDALKVVETLAEIISRCENFDDVKCVQRDLAAAMRKKRIPMYPPTSPSIAGSSAYMRTFEELPRFNDISHVVV